MNLRPHGPQPCALPDCATSRKSLFIEVSFNTSFLDLPFQLHCLSSIGTRVSLDQYPRPSLGCIFFTTTIMCDKSFLNIVRLTNIILAQRFTIQYVNNKFHHFMRPSRHRRDTLPGLSRSSAGTAPHPEIGLQKYKS